MVSLYKNGDASILAKNGDVYKNGDAFIFEGKMGTHLFSNYLNIQ
tara:strand:- start:1139 stop:1273 length:135 start_codon:yes stop_codon:yes gene_type:complete